LIGIEKYKFDKKFIIYKPKTNYSSAQYFSFATIDWIFTMKVICALFFTIFALQVNFSTQHNKCYLLICFSLQGVWGQGEDDLPHYPDADDSTIRECIRVLET
jgi:hypothetical protein